jgi:hypothetical protein
MPRKMRVETAEANKIDFSADVRREHSWRDFLERRGSVGDARRYRTFTYESFLGSAFGDEFDFLAGETWLPITCLHVAVCFGGRISLD